MVSTGLVALGLTIFLAYCVHTVTNKRVATLKEKSRNLFIAYFWAAFFSLVIALVGCGLMGADFEWRFKMWFVFGTGVANAYAVYCHWTATDINQTVTSLSTWLDDLIPLILGIVFLGEFQYLNYWIVIGILLAMASSVALATQTDSFVGIDLVSVRQIYKNILIYSVVWGYAGFLIRDQAIDKLPVLSFIIPWYFGSFVGTWLVYYFINYISEKGESSTVIEATKRGAMFAASAIASMFAVYWAKSLIPLVKTQPIFQISEMVFPTLIGLLIFGERKNFTWRGWAFISIGLVGGLIIALNL